MNGRLIRQIATIGSMGLSIGCSGAAKPEAAPDPSRPVRLLAATDADLLGISLAAGADVKASRGLDGVVFEGVFVNDREVRAISDSVTSANGFTRGERRDSRRPFVVCRLGSPCPEAAGAPRPKAPVAFTSFRVARDSAYVGGTWFVSGDGRPPHPEALCIVLLKSPSQWSAVGRGPIARADDCGR